MHGVCNRLRRTQALLVGGSSHKPPVSHTLPVDVVSCTLPLHEYITFSQKMWEHPTYDKGASTTPTRNKLIYKYRKATQAQPILSISHNKENAKRIKSNYARRKTHIDRRQPTSFIHLLLIIITATISLLLLLLPSSSSSSSSPDSLPRGERLGKLLDPTIRPHAVLTSKAPRLLLVEVSAGWFLT